MISPRPTVSASISDAIFSSAEQAKLILDEHQLGAIGALSEFGAAVMASRGANDRAPRGLYLWGTVGRGKTWLSDAFFAALPTPAKRRVHFHAFYRQLQSDLYRDGIAPAGEERSSAIDAAIDALLDDVDLLFFDEFHLHDAGDATLALRVLRALIARRVPLLATSNYPPEGLLPDPMFHHLFEPGIALIRQNFAELALGGTTDYRRLDQADAERSGFSRGAWQAQGLLPEPEASEAATLRENGHTFAARRAADGELWFHFDDVCETATAAGDYLSWAARFPRWVVEAIPPLSTCSPQARQRFLNLVDVLNDQGIEATFISEHSPAQVLAGGPKLTARGASADREELGLGLDGLPIDVARTASRLALLRRPA